ncbi:breast cancer type 2 susceptibility protein isoform X2 [Dicentrarchus labrax]|uniref:breast cancer type 2 susceptibility protein isoform X2 n=1 Tax=Dicentrarchus labrax TaxID=13489 RepID=UPI0021F69325|nr:breast cancer type 2 susceptibility protein isoform X2 [Dicentrarchus labrax]
MSTGMDLPSKNMYDTLKDEIWKELGPLDPDWFEALTAQTNDGNVSDQDDLCANQEGHFKAPFDKTAIDSQLFSTPKVFRHSRIVSPETEDEQWFTAEKEKETPPWMATQSPNLFHNAKEGVPGAKYGDIQPQSQDSFGLLHTAQKSPVSYAKNISESLGAQIHHDMSWTSSLNTPPAIPSTLILTKPDESPIPASVSADKNVVFVRKLFPSLSNASKVGVVSPKNGDMPTVQQGVVSPEADQHPECHTSPQSSLNQRDFVWRQKLPDAIEDGEIRRTVASVLDGAEDVLSLFFTNSSSALRKVKTDRIKRKQIIPTKELGSSSTDILTSNNAASSEQRTADQEPGRLPSPPLVKTGDIGITQWSPLSLSEIPPCTVDTSCRDNSPATQMENNISTEQLQNDFDSGQLVRPPVKIRDYGFTKKKRKFVYTVETLDPQVLGKDTQSQKMDSSPVIPDSGQEVNVKQLLKAPDEADCIGKNRMQKQGNLTEESPPSVQAKVQDLDISQLSRDFAQDFSQMSDSGKLSEVAGDTPRNGFSPSACLSAMKQANQKARQANLHHDSDGVSTRTFSTTNQNSSINEGTVSDSGFQSAVADISCVTASSFVLPSSKNNGQSQQWTGFKTDIHWATPFPSTKKGNGKAQSDDILQEAETDAKQSSAVKESQTVGPGREIELPIENKSTQLISSAKITVDNINCIPLNGQIHGSLPEKTTVSLPSIHASGFKTASNKGIQISSANMERAKHLFEDTKVESFSDQPIKCAHGTEDKLHKSHGSVKNPTSNSNQPSSSENFVDSSCHLTASQKADVTELCTLLEEADSQFEFTQFKTAKLKQHCQDTATSAQKVDKELDPDFLTGIDFDDSFNSDGEQHLAVTVIHDKITLVSDGKPNRETCITGKSTSLSLPSAIKKENSSTEDMSFSSKYISKGSRGIVSAKTKNLDRAGHTETSKLENKNPLMLGVGFKTAGGNVLRVSKKCLSKARALFADLDQNLVTSQKFPDKLSSETDAKTQQKRSVDNHTGNFLHHKEDNSKFTGHGNDTVGCFSTMTVFSDRPVTGKRVEVGTNGFKNNKMETTNLCQSGFQMASGKGISISAKAMQEADAFFKDCDVTESNVAMSVKQKKNIEPLPSVSHTKNLKKCKNVQEMEVNFSEEPVSEFENVNAECHSEVVQHNVEIPTFGFKNKPASFHGNPSWAAKALPSVSCATSRNISSSVASELSNGGGFCTASGEKVFVSADAMKKAEDIHTPEDTNKQLKQKDALRTGYLANQIQVSPPTNGGFQTASGRGVAISAAALKKARSLLSQCDEVEDKIGVKPTHSKMPAPALPPRKPVAFSSDALQKAKALFSDIHFSAEIPAVSGTRNGDRKQVGAGNKEIIQCGFLTAGGTKVHVSQKSLLKAKNLLKEFDDGSVSTKAMQEADAFFKDMDIIDSEDGMLVKHKKSIEPLSGSDNEKKFKQDQRVRNISEEPGSGCTEFENVTVRPVENHEKMLHSDDVEIPKGVFKNTPDSTNGASLHGNPYLKAQTLSSPLCTTSKNELSNSGGFCTASGKKVLDDPMTKAHSLLNGSAMFDDTNKELKHNVETMPPLNGGFQTASGKGLTISSAALKKAKTLLSEYEGVVDEIGVKPTHSKMPVPALPPRNCGFLAASGKPVAFSSEALQKAKALFSNIRVSAEIPAVSDTRKSEHKDARNDTEKNHCGFTTAGGAKVHVSQKNVLKAKELLKNCDDDCISTKEMQDAGAFFKDCDIMDGKESMPLKHRKSIAPVSGSGSKNKNLSKFEQDQRAAINICEEPGSGRSEFKNVTVGPVVIHEKMLHSEGVEIHKGGLKNMPDSTNAASLHGNPSLISKPLSSPLCTSSKNIGCSAISEFSNSGGFCTASGKQVSVSDHAMTKAHSLLNESAMFDDTNKELKHKVETVLPQNGGFQTASGKGVVISSAALKKAKTLLSECEGVEDKIDVKPTHCKMPNPPPPPRHCGFLAASGKPVAFSSEALEKAKALLSDTSFSTEIPTVSDTRESEHRDARNDTEKIHCGFTTAGGAKVHVSQTNLSKAKNLLKEFADGECHSNSHLATASDKDLPTKESAPLVVKPLTSLQVTDNENETERLIKEKASTDGFKIEEGKITSSVGGNLHDSPEEEMSSVLDYAINQTSSSGGSKVKKTEESPVLFFQSLNLSGCTETQQKFLAQEALDCTKALLEDESLRLSMTSENVPLQDNLKCSNKSVEEQKGTGKRLAEDPDMAGQPPLKRRLLEEFDRTVDGPRGSTLRPEISSPNVVMKDRRVFRYSVSLHPNITTPHRNGINYVETRLQKTTPTRHSSPGDSRSAHSKMPTFVPPFLKSAKTESRKNTVLKDNIRTPPVFVPPFKKQRTIVQESSSKPQEEEDKTHHLFVTPFNSNTYVPPATDVTGNKSKDIQTVALADTTNDNLIHNQNLPVGCGSENSRVEDTLSTSQDMFQNLPNVELARDMQDMRIRKKKRQNIRPLPGSLFLTKTCGVSRIALKAAVNGKPPARYTQKQLYEYGVHQHVYAITSETAESFRFNLQQFVKKEAFIDGGGVQLADGGWLIPSNDGTAGKEEFYRALCDTPGVDPKLISEDWVYNHYRWIVWKQASMERSFPETMGSLCLTPEQVLLQLKYRYDVEVDHSRRPALRKIMEKDDTAAKTIVLCVCGVVSRGLSPKRHSFSDIKTPGAESKVENPSAVVWLTDGWYTIKAQLDEPLTAMLHRGRLAVGGKMIINGAQLVGSQDACSPLEAPDSLMLKICANSSRPTRWDAKLGFHKDPRPFLLPVSCLYSSGGPVGCVDIVILRSYPIQWMERKPDGGVVFRSVRAEEREARRYNSHKQKAMENLFAKIQAEFEKDEKGNNKPQRRRRTITRRDIASLQDGEELYEAVGDDPAYHEANLSEQQLETLRTFRRSLLEKKQAELQDRYRRALENAEDCEGSCLKRDVTPVWRLCFADSMDQPGNVYQLNLWRPPSDLQSLLKEGSRYKVYNLATSDGKKHGGSTVQLTGTKKTQFQDLQASKEWLATRFQPRVCSHFVDLQNQEFQPLCGEVDLTGYVISIIDGQAFYLSDGRLNFVKVRCFSSLAQSGLEDVVKPRVLLALSNLQLRGQSMSPAPVVYAGDLTVFSTNPKEAHLHQSLSQLRNLVQGQENFFLTAEEKLSHLVKSDGLTSISSPALQTRTPASTIHSRQDTKTNLTSQQPVRSLGSFTPVSRNPPAKNCSTEKDPASLKRRRALDYLSRIPSPPPLPHLGSMASPCIKKTFNPPRRSGTQSTLKTAQTPARKPASSPVEDEWVNDEELAMIDTQALLVGDLGT